MSQAAIEDLARRWNCSTADVIDRITTRLKTAGLLPAAATPRRLEPGEDPERRIRVAVDEDGGYYVETDHGWLPL